MDDLISRQKAIEFIKDTSVFVFYKHGGSGTTVESEIDFVEDIIKQTKKAIISAVKLDIPSAQPEIIRCKDCKHGALNGRYGCRVYHYWEYEIHDMKPEDFCSLAERRTDE